MTDLSLVPPIRRCLVALAITAAASLLLLGYSSWAASVLPSHDYTHAWEVLRSLIGLAIVALALGLLAVPVRLGLTWSRFAVFIGGVPVAVMAGLLTLVERDLDRIDWLLPPGFVEVQYACLVTIAVAALTACLLMRNPEAREFMYRRQQRADDPRVWTIKPRD